jgi:hypothetical protein
VGEDAGDVLDGWLARGSKEDWGDGGTCWATLFSPWRIIRPTNWSIIAG